MGLLLGLILAGGHGLLGLLPLENGLHGLLLLLLWVLLTGGLHLDGLADSCDGLFAAVPPARRLAILKDVHVGAFGVMGLVLVLGLKAAALAALAKTPAGWMALLLAPVWGRWMLVWAAERFPYARAEASLGGTMRTGLSPRQTALATGTALLLQLAGTLLAPGAVFMLIGPGMGLLLARWAARRLGGGLTGDVYGALCEVTETVVLVAAAGVFG
ncbi:MAG: adenosylcobinamide-GDP ribazoletransferase [Caldilineae bacterium]|nr:MAG: adenosylcobinamide-GDP ribazoletransferase [Caldilineae bacterium]